MQKACLENIQGYSEPCVTPAYSESWYIQNPGIFRTRGICRTPYILRTEVYLEPWDTQNLRQIQKPVKHLRWSIVQKLFTAIVAIANYNYFCNSSCSCSLLFLI